MKEAETLRWLKDQDQEKEQAEEQLKQKAMIEKDHEQRVSDSEKFKNELKVMINQTKEQAERLKINNALLMHKINAFDQMGGSRK